MAKHNGYPKDYVLRSAQVFDSCTFFFVAETRPPDDWKPGRKRHTQTVALCYNVRTGDWSEKPMAHRGTSLANSTGPFAPTDKATVFFTRANRGEKLAKIMYVLAYDGTFSVEQLEQISYQQAITVIDAAHIGETFYVIGNEQTVLRRQEAGKYERIHYKEGGESILTHEDWWAIGGFSETDIYTTGTDLGEGSVFHFDGTDWSPMQLPSNIGEFNGRAIICTPDGYILAVSHGGKVVRGRAGEAFETLINPDPLTGPVVFGSDAVAWFQGALYMSTMSQLYVMADSDWTPVTFEKGYQPTSFKGLATNGEILLQYGEFGASYFDGDAWIKV